MCKVDGAITRLLMYSKQSGQDDGPVSRPVRTSDRLRKRPKLYSPQYNTFYERKINLQRMRSKSRTLPVEKVKNSEKQKQHLETQHADADENNLRRSTRQRKMPTNLGFYTDRFYTNSSGSEDNDMMDCNLQLHSRPATRNHVENIRGSHDEPRREGLRPRHGQLSHYNTRVARGQLHSESDDDRGTSAEGIGQDEVENGNDVEYNDDCEGEEDAGGDGDGEDEGEDEGEDDGDDEEGEGQEVRRRYDLRNRADVRKISIEEGKKRSRSPRHVLHQGMGTKVNRDVRRGGSRIHKRRRLTRAEDSDDSLLVDELDQGPPIPSLRGGSRPGPPWLLGGPDIHGTTAWGLNIAASGWGHQSDSLASFSSGIQTAGPSSKGGADIQPLQVDDSVSFDDIGGLSEYIDALKEMVFFPLLYPDFFASYNITPPRGVLLCGPPGTGKTLIARALASAASKAGQKVSFYMRKGADVLSKWVGEAERQLKLLFEEAQKNQPSIIFFDEIDGLAPVRSSKQEQIHNSIVSTLLALMDGLDSRGQVVLIGATNRVDAIDGALRRPGRFDREFNFPLPGVEARAEILDIHTRKWKQAPSNELKLELAASCVGYCGADLKALCTEAAIRAFREKYPQVYTSDDKFLIDVDSVKVEKSHFIEAMSTITPAAHRGSVVHSRPLSFVIAPCLQTQLRKAMNIVSDIFPVATSLESTKLSMLSHGSLMPLVYRPRFLLCGGEGVGLDHAGPAILHELEKFPVHSLGLPSLLSDPGAKTPEEALVHIFGEARRTTPSILYLPQFHLWWENAHEQLKAVLLTLLEELPSGLPILLLGTSSVKPDDLPDNAFAVFSLRNIFYIGPPSPEDRYAFFDRLIEAALSVDAEHEMRTSNRIKTLPELPKAPKVVYAPKVSEIKAKAESQGHALRRMRMCLRDVCNRILYDKRFSAFHYPVVDEDAPNYRAVIQNPMDMATLLQRVDSGCYLTCKAFLEDFELISMNAKKYNGDDYNGARIVSRAYELRDAVHGMLSQMDPALVSFCEKIAEEGGPVSVPEEFEGLALPQTPVVQASTLTRSSARLRNVQLEVNLDQSYEVLKRSKKNVDATELGSTTDDASQSQAPAVPKSCKECDADCTIHHQQQGNLQVDCSQTGSSVITAVSSSHDVIMSDGDISDKVETIKQQLLEHTKTYGIPQLERLYTRVMKGVFETKNASKGENARSSILSFLLKFADNESNF